MSFLGDLIFGGVDAGSRPPDDDDRWYAGTTAPLSRVGVRVTPELAQRVSAVFAAVRVRSEAVASLPLIVYRRRADGGKERAPEHPLYELLHDQPNPWQTSYEWRAMMEAHLSLRGNAYSEIVPGPRGFADALVPLHPDRVQVEQLPDGRPRYRYNAPNGRPRVLVQDEVMHLRGLSHDGARGVSSNDGLRGLSVIELAAESIGVSYAAQAYNANFLGHGSSPSGVLRHPKTLTKEAAERLKVAWQKKHGGFANAFRVAVLEEGMEWQAIGISAKDAQLLELLNFQVADIARWFRVPPHMIGDLSRATFSNIEHQGLEFVIHSLRPDLVNWEQAIRRDLILAPQTYFAEFLVDGLLRGDAASRAEYYSSAIQAGWMTRNEARRLENMNPLPGLDEPLAPVNLAPAGEGAGDDEDLDEEAVAAARVARRIEGRMERALRRIEEGLGARMTAALADFMERRERQR